MEKMARGYIASGEFKGCRTAQHIQNQVIKNYCDSKNLVFILSRAEYWINGSTQCQLWAALQEGYKHVVFFSIWQLPDESKDRKEIFRHCRENKITLHFASERLSIEKSTASKEDIETLVQINHMINEMGNDQYLDLLNALI